MSQSPTNNTDTNTLLRYQQGWRALNRLLHTDRSFSGSERNCVFLNLGNQGDFAAISAVSGLDYLDDGRAVAACDWDFDGQLDLWLTARTAPRLRFVRNQQQTDGHFVAFYLRGNGITTNRDAVGARVEVHLAGDPATKLMRTRHAGDGFLSQSSHWIHFGLGQRDRIDRVVVRWPGGEQETFTNVAADAFQILRQGKSQAEIWTPPTSRQQLTPSTPASLAVSQAARIVPPIRLPLPRLRVDWKSEAPPTDIFQDDRVSAPTLVTVWTSSCPICLGELAEWSQQAEEFSRHKLNVIALNADIDADGGAAAKVVERVGLPFTWGVAKPPTVRNLDLFQRGIMDRWQPMPVPCSFLVDGNSNVVAVYKGPTDVAQIIRDLELIDVSDEQIRVASSPFSGRWSASVPVADPLRISSQMLDHAQISEAIAYLQYFIRTPAAKAHPLRLADVQYILSILLESQAQKERALAVLRAAKQLSPHDVRIRAALGRLLGESQQPGEASVELAAALEVNPSDRKARSQLAVALMQSGKAIEAVPHLTALLQDDPQDASVLFLMASSQSSIGNWRAAIKHYQEVLRIAPTRLLAANNLAYILAAHPDASLRDAKAAVRLATEICERTKHSNPQFLDTLAVAYAADGEFEKAVEVSERAAELLKNRPGAESTIEQIQARIKLFQQQQPFREQW